MVYGDGFIGAGRGFTDLATSRATWITVYIQSTLYGPSAKVWRESRAVERVDSAHFKGNEVRDGRGHVAAARNSRVRRSPASDRLGWTSGHTTASITEWRIVSRRPINREFREPRERFLAGVKLRFHGNLRFACACSRKKAKHVCLHRERRTPLGADTLRQRELHYPRQDLHLACARSFLGPRSQCWPAQV